MQKISSLIDSYQQDYLPLLKAQVHKFTIKMYSHGYSKNQVQRNLLRIIKKVMRRSKNRTKNHRSSQSIQIISKNTETLKMNQKIYCQLIQQFDAYSVEDLVAKSCDEKEILEEEIVGECKKSKSEGFVIKQLGIERKQRSEETRSLLRRQLLAMDTSAQDHRRCDRVEWQKSKIEKLMQRKKQLIREIQVRKYLENSSLYLNKKISQFTFEFQ